MCSHAVVQMNKLKIYIFQTVFKPVHRRPVQQDRPTGGTQRRAVGMEAASFGDNPFLHLRRRKCHFPLILC